MKVYVAAPYARLTMAYRVARYLEADGHHVTSTWHETGLGLEFDPIDIDSRRRALKMNVIDLNIADAMVALTSSGTPRATFAEIGFAIAQNKPVIWLQGAAGEGANIFDAHPLVSITHDWQSIAALVRRRCVERLG